MALLRRRAELFPLRMLFIKGWHSRFWFFLTWRQITIFCRLDKERLQEKIRRPCNRNLIKQIALERSKHLIAWSNRLAVLRWTLWGVTTDVSTTFAEVITRAEDQNEFQFDLQCLLVQVKVKYRGGLLSIVTIYILTTLAKVTHNQKIISFSFTATR